MSLPVTFSLHVIQIVNLQKTVFDQCFIESFHGEALDNHDSWKDFPSWMKQYNSISSTYHKAFCHKLEADTSKVEKAICSEVAWMGKHCSRVDAFSSHLFFEPHLRQWLILYELAFESNLRADDDGLPQIRPSDKRTSLDFYNELRDFFVISDGIEKKSTVIYEIEREARDFIQIAMAEFYGIKIDKNADIVIPESAGNITLFAMDSDFGNVDPSSFPIIDYLTAAHECAERIGSDATVQSAADIPKYIFWGRFHTVACEDFALVVRIMPIHFQAQLFWAYLSATDKYIQDLEERILEKNLFTDDVVIASLDALINSIEYAHFMNERFRRSIEGDADLIYGSIEERWHIASSLEQNRVFAKFLANNIDRSLQERTLKSEKNQNKLLSVLTVLGFLALIDTWSSFLDMTNEGYDSALQNSMLGNLFDQATLMMFNTGFSAVVAILCVAAIVYFLTRK